MYINITHIRVHTHRTALGYRPNEVLSSIHISTIEIVHRCICLVSAHKVQYYEHTKDSQVGSIHGRIYVAT